MPNIKELHNKHKISRFQNFIIRKPALVMGVLWGFMMFLVFSVISALNSENSKQLLIALIINAIVWSTGGFVFGKLMKRINAKREAKSNLNLSEQDRIDLFKWYKFGEVPTSAHLQPILKSYVDFLESNVRGKSFASSNKERIVGLVLFGTFFMLQIWLTISELSYGNVGRLVLFGLFVVLFISAKPNKPNRLFEFLGRKSLTKIMNMRKQLK
jgi:hypothetical protein